MTRRNPSLWNGRNVLVTGASGFVGSWLTRALASHGAHVTGLMLPGSVPPPSFQKNQDMRLVEGKLEDLELLKNLLSKHRIQTVFHLGAQAQVQIAQEGPLSTFDANIRGTYHVLEACRMHGDIEHILVASSDKAYGDHGGKRYTEDMPLKGIHPYDVSKTCTDILAQSYSQSFQLPVTIVRCGNLYGGQDLHWSRIVPSTIKSLLQNEQPVLRSNGETKRDYLSIEDAIEAYLTIGEHYMKPGIVGEAFNIGSGEGRCVLEIVEILQRLTGRTDLDPRILGTAQQEIPAQVLDIKKAKRILGWEPRISLQEGLTRAIAWYQRYLQSPHEAPGTSTAYSRARDAILRRALAGKILHAGKR